MLVTGVWFLTTEYQAVLIASINMRAWNKMWRQLIAAPPKHTELPQIPQLFHMFRTGNKLSQEMRS